MTFCSLSFGIHDNFLEERLFFHFLVIFIRPSTDSMFSSSLFLSNSKIKKKKSLLLLETVPPVASNLETPQLIKLCPLAQFSWVTSDYSIPIFKILQLPFPMPISINFKFVHFQDLKNAVLN